MNKQEMMADWLKANPDKSERDWLLEVRCSGKQREAMSRLLGKLDEAGIEYAICCGIKNYYTDYQVAPLNSLTEVFFDLAILPGVGKNSWLIETDMPEMVLGQQTERRNESIPEEAFKWLLGIWFPDFDFASLSEKDYDKLMWENMGGLLQGIIGKRGFPDWTAPEFADSIVSRYKKDKAFIEAQCKS